MMGTSAAEAVLQGRKASAELRKPRVRGGRNGAATERMLARRQRELDNARAVLAELGRNDLASALFDEHDLAKRVADAKLMGQRRPELMTRLAKARATLRYATTGVSS